MTNARCLTEGVDVPATDCVLFADPKQSRIDIVQAAGRALRRYPGKEYGYILLPLIVPRKMEFSKFAETTAFRKVAHAITALSIQDERIAEEFRAIEKGRISSGKIVEIEGDVSVGMKIKAGDFAKAISTRIWDSVGRANWRNFKDARAFVRGLGLKRVTEWVRYCNSGGRPPTFRLIHSLHTLTLAGSHTAIGSGRVRSLLARVNIVPLIRLERRYVGLN
jgi:predicted helicase